MLKRLLQLLALSALALSASLALAQRTPILVYTALETDQLKSYKDTFEKAVKDVEIRWVRDSTGVITAKLLAEKNNPQADAVFALAATSLLVLEQEGMLTPYAPKGVEALNPRFVDSKKPPMWVGMDVWGATICFNTVEAKKRNLPKPESWKDLLKPIYKGQITMPHPASSGTGFLDVTAWLQMFGEAEGWKYMDALHENIAQYVHSASKPCRQAGAGEFVMGISFEYRANATKASGAPIELVFPKEGVDWGVTREANELYAKGYAIVAMPGVAKPLPNVPANYEQMLVKNDFGWAAKNRERILAEWEKRYNAKAEPK